EDWKNTKLTLNTTSPALARAILPHSGLKIQPGAAPNGQNGGFPDRFNKGGLAAHQMNMLPQLQQQQQFQQQHQMQQQQQAVHGQPIIIHQPRQQLQQQATVISPPRGQPIILPGQPMQQMQQASALFLPHQQQAQAQQPTRTFGGYGSSAFVTSMAASDGPQVIGGYQELAGAAAVDPATMGDAAFNYADAVAESTAVSATYKIEGKATIFSGIATHKVVISTSTVLPIEVYVVTMPRVQPWACLQAKIKNTSTEPMLAGLASIFNDDSYVSSTQMPLVSPGDSFICSLGMDNKITVSFAHKDGNVVINNIPFAGNTE
ncbi:hypothetical protein M407DRAFT_27200, partial [Tulasnella calospora MUT 4182]